MTQTTTNQPVINDFGRDVSPWRVTVTDGTRTATVRVWAEDAAAAREEARARHGGVAVRVEAAESLLEVET